MNLDTQTRAGNAPLGRADYLIAVLFGLANLVVMVFIVRAAMPGYISYSDGTPYLIQADIFSRGRLAETAAPEKVMPFFATNGMIAAHGRWFSRQPPGTSALLALLERLVGNVHVVPPILSALALVVTYLWVRRAYGRKIAASTAMIYMILPVVTEHRCMPLSYIPSTLLCVTLMLVLTYAVSHPRSGVPPLLCGLLVGAEVTVRPYTAILVATAAFGSRALVFRRHRLVPLHFLWFAAGASVGVAVLLAHNRMVTGSWFPLAFTLYDANDRLGFGLRGLVVGGGGVVDHTPAMAVDNLLRTCVFAGATFFCLFAWLIPVLVWWVGRAVSRRRSSYGRMLDWDWCLLLFTGAIVLGHMAYWCPRPISYFETIPLVTVLISRGIWYMLGGGRGLRWMLYLIGPALILLTASMAWKGFRSSANVSQQIDRTVADVSKETPKALIFVRARRYAMLGAFETGGRMPGLFNRSLSRDQRVIYAVDRGRDNAHLLSHYPDHRPYVISIQPAKGDGSAPESYTIEIRPQSMAAHDSAQNRQEGPSERGP